MENLPIQYADFARWQRRWLTGELFELHMNYWRHQTEYRLPGQPESWLALPPIGKPIANSSVRILDRFMQPVSVGVVGEIYLSGECVVLEYLDRPAQTTQRFLPYP